MKLISHALTSALLLLVSSGLQASERPNIVLLMAEDLSPRIGAFGDPVALTPNIDQLASEGVRYTNVFTTAGVCAPSRAATIMGAHQVSFGAQHMRTSGKDYKTVPPESMKAFPEMLRRQGYYALTDAKLDYQFSGATTGSGPSTVWDLEGWRTGIKDAPTTKPFYAHLNFNITHESGIFPPLGHWPEGISHFIMQIMRTFWGGSADPVPSITPDKIQLEPYYPDTPTVREDITRHYHNITAMDAQVGEVLSYLKETGLDDTTIVIWTTDHGDGLPRAKRELYDSGLKVPMIIRWPEHYRPEHLEPGQVDSQLISFIDLAPTILAMAKNRSTTAKAAELAPQFQGRNFLGAEEPRRYIFASRDRIDEVPDRQRAVRDQRYKYIRSYHPEQEGGHYLDFRNNIPMMREMFELLEEGELNEQQALWFAPPGKERLFDLLNDPYELRDLSNSPEHQATLTRLRMALDARLNHIGDSSNVSEETMIESFLVNGKQGVSAKPEIQTSNGFVSISAANNASIAYQINDGKWQLYTKPIKITANEQLTAKAVRYGWEESEPVSVRLN